MKLPYGFCVLVLSALMAPTDMPAVEERPNILWIVTDDQRFDSIASFNRARRGNSESELGMVLSPNVDRLASMGTTFINAFNHTPSCQPSRTIMHTGRYSHR